MQVITRYAIILTLAIATSGCMATTQEMARQTPVASWRFQSDLESTTTCLTRAMNAEWQASSWLARNIVHSVASAGPGVNHIVHDEIGAGTAWLFVVRSDGKGAIAEARISELPIAENAREKMANAAATCKGAAATI